MKKILFISIIALFVVKAQFAQDTQEKPTVNTEDAKLANKLYNESLKLYDEEKYLEGINLLNKAIGLRPDFDKAFYNRSCMYLQANRLDEAIADLNAALEIRPSAEYYTARGYVYLLKRFFKWIC